MKKLKLEETIVNMVLNPNKKFRANLYDANLYDANLYDANLEGTNLEGANLRGANLCETDRQRSCCD